MSSCPSIDSLATIGTALEWDVDAGLRHLTSCADCAEALRSLESTHNALAATEDVGDDIVAKISHLITAEAMHERAKQERAQNVGKGIEAILAGLTAVAITSGGGAGLTDGVSAIVFALAASAVLAYRVFTSNQSSASRSSSGAIQ